MSYARKTTRPAYGDHHAARDYYAAKVAHLAQAAAKLKADLTNTRRLCRLAETGLRRSTAKAQQA